MTMMNEHVAASAAGARPLLEQEVRTPKGIVTALADAGVQYVFGMPGGYTGSIFAALHGHPTIRVIQVREEAIGSIAAEAAARTTGRPVAVMGQGEWIVGNAGQGMLEALLGSSPLIVLTEMSDGGPLSHHGYYQAGTGDYGAWDARNALAAVTKRVFVATEPAQAVQMTQLAVKHALSGAPGPAAVVFHSRSLAGTVGPSTTPRLYRSGYYLPARPTVDRAAVERLANLLGEADKPVIIAGNGVRLAGASDALIGLARRLGAPVATTAAGKGVVDERDPLALGVMGTFGRPRANSTVATADLVLAIGTRLAPIDTADESPNLIDPARQRLLQVDVEPLHASWTYPCELTVVGDARDVLEQLAVVLGDGDRISWAVDGDEETAIAVQRGASEDFPMHPQHLIRQLQELWPEDGVVTSDAGENRLFMLHWFRSGGSGRYLMPAAGGGMGYAMPAALGVKVADPERPVLAVVGDGGFAVSVSTLMTAVQEQVPITVVVLNNAALGWVAHGMGARAVAAHFMDFDHAAIARSMGCEGVRVGSSEELRTALLAARDSDRPFVIDVPTNMETSFMDIVQPISSGRWKEGE